MKLIIYENYEIGIYEIKLQQTVIIKLYLQQNALY